MQPFLETARLLIRIDTYEAYAAAFATLDDAALKIMFGFQTDEELQAQKSKLAGGLITYRTSLRFFHLILKEQQEVIGGFAYHNWYPEHLRSEIGYEIKAVGYRNQGIMKEALPHLIRHGFDSMGLKRMEAFIDPDNTASRKLVEGAGFAQEGRLKQRYRYGGAPTDALVYGLLAQDDQP